MSIIKKIIVVICISFSVFANDIDAEIMNNIDFYMNMHLLEGKEDRIELFQNDEYEKTLDAQLNNSN